MIFKGQLYNHQDEAVDKLIRSRYAILAHDMGLGKSITALAVAVKVGLPTLIICPAYLRKKWTDEDVGEFVEGGEFKIISYSELVKLEEELERYPVVIADEAHYLKNLDAKRTKAFHNYIMKKAPDYMMLLSGTPIKNRIPEIFSLLQLCYYGNNYPNFKSFYRLYHKFCNTFSNRRMIEIAGRRITQYEGLRNVEGLKRLIKPIYFRKRADGTINLPEQNRRDIVIKATSIYDAKMNKALELYENNDPSYMTLKSINARAKTPATIELAKNIIDEGKQVIIYTDHIIACQEIASELGVTPIDGSVNPEVRMTLVDRFKKQLSPALVATIGSLSTGVNLTNCNYMIFNDFPYVPADLEQAEKRIHRIGQDKPCFYYYMFISPIDKKIYRAIRSKMDTIREVNNER
jgi:SWI/SNF-related matrix-associated actin-dependent regulator 1 of chromatin subfamily A